MGEDAPAGTDQGLKIELCSVVAFPLVLEPFGAIVEAAHGDLPAEWSRQRQMLGLSAR